MVGRRNREGGRRKEAGGRRKEEGERRQKVQRGKIMSRKEVGYIGKERKEGE